jgi:hypothetical protein
MTLNFSELGFKGFNLFHQNFDSCFAIFFVMTNIWP